MAITNFIPEIWSSKLLLNFQRDAVFAGLVNREFEGEASKGNTVHIAGITDVAIKDYKAAGRTTTADAISDTGVDLLIDQEKNFDFFVDDIDRAQAGRSFDAYTQSASNGLVQDADKFLAALAVTGGTALTNTVAPTDAKSAWANIEAAQLALDVADVPADQRIIVANPYFAKWLTGYDSKLTSVDTSGDSNGLRRATIGEIAGFRVVKSNNLPAAAGKAQFVAFHQSALAFVSQIEKTEAMRAENKFADRLRGLHVYGAKALRPTAIQVYTAV
jgi:hypothetical protein